MKTICEDARLLKTDEFVVTIGSVHIFTYLSDAVYEKDLNSTWNVHPHNHRNYEIHYIKSGKISLKYQQFNENSKVDKTVRLSDGDFCIIKPMVYHSISTDGGNVNKISFNFDYKIKNKDAVGETFDRLFAGLDTVTVLHGADDLGGILSTIFDTQASCIPEFIGYKRKTLLQWLFLNLTERLSPVDYSTRMPQVKTDMSEDTKRRYKIELFLDHALNLNGEVRLQDLADFLALSPKQAARVLQKEYGKSFSLLLTEFRIQNAKNLLKNTDTSVGEIAEMVGYETSTGFIHTFKRIMGMTPLEYRKQSAKRGEQ